MRELKYSGVEWIGEMPKDWELTKIGSVYQERNIRVSDKEYKPLSVTKQGIVPQLETAAKTDNGDSRKLIKKGDFVINSRSDRRGACGISEYEGSCSLINIVLQPKKNMCNRYYEYVFQSDCFADEFYRWGNGIVDDLWSTKWTNMKRIYLPVPTLEEQKRIADYLEEICTKIDTAIMKQNKIIEKLKIFKISFINENIHNCGGEKCHLGYIGSMKNGLNFSSTIEGETMKFLGVGDFQDYFVLDEFDLFSDIVTSDYISEEYMLRDRDIILVRSNGSKDLVGRAVMVKNIDFSLAYSGFCIRFRNTRTDIVDSGYLLYFFRSFDFRKQLERYSHGSNINNINQELISQIDFVFPDIESQKKVVNILEEKCKLIDENIIKRSKIINKLTAYKKSLIYEVTTGKLFKSY